MFDWFVEFNQFFRADLISIGSYSFSFFDVWLWSCLGSLLIWAFNKFTDL